jgi:hypothetical protein
MSPGWRDDGCVIKAVIPALQFLAESEKIHVLHGSCTKLEHLLVPPVLRTHGIAAEVYVLPIPRVFGRALLDKAHAVDADMLVMGAYFTRSVALDNLGRCHALHA